MEKIRIIVAHTEQNIIDRIVTTIRKFENVDVIFTTNNGLEAFDKIIELNPTMVFIGYNIEGLDGFHIILNSEMRLHEKMPIYNIVANEVSQSELKLLLKLLPKKKINALVREPLEDRCTNILCDYIDYKYK